MYAKNFFVRPTPRSKTSQPIRPKTKTSEGNITVFCGKILIIISFIISSDNYLEIVYTEYSA
jgi:hypothetical protein